MHLERIAAGSRQTNRLCHRDSPMIACEIDNRERECRKFREHDALHFQLCLEVPDLCRHRLDEEINPRLPVWRWLANCRLCATKREVVRVFVLFDHTLE